MSERERVGRTERERKRKRKRERSEKREGEREREREKERRVMGSQTFTAGLIATRSRSAVGDS